MKKKSSPAGQVVRFAAALTIGGVVLVNRAEAAFESYAQQLSTPLSAVPEPETYALMLAGLGLVGALRRQR